MKKRLSFNLDLQEKTRKSLRKNSDDKDKTPPFWKNLNIHRRTCFTTKKEYTSSQSEDPSESDEEETEDHEKNIKRAENKQIMKILYPDKEK